MKRNFIVGSTGILIKTTNQGEVKNPQKYPESLEHVWQVFNQKNSLP